MRQRCAETLREIGKGSYTTQRKDVDKAEMHEKIGLAGKKKCRPRRKTSGGITKKNTWR